MAGGGRRDAAQRGQSRRLTRMRDVATEAGVSVTTVSVVLSGTPNSGIPVSTQERVRDAALRLGYVPNFSAQALRTKRSHTLGFITDGIATSPFAGEMIAGAQAAAWKSGYVLLIVDTGELEELANSAAQVLLARRVEGVIVASWFHRPVDVPAALRTHKPVLANCFSKVGDFAAIVPDEVGGGYAATYRLLERQPGPVGFISLDDSVPAGPGRLEVYKRALDGAGIAYDPSIVMVNPAQRHLLREAYELTNELLDRRPDVKLLFCYNDRAAMGSYEAVKARGLRIPDDIAIVGFDNQTIIADELLPGLTTVQLPHYEMGERAVERALKTTGPATRGAPPAQVELAPCTLVERQSA
jgi:LacI family transcriptional regulator